MTEVEIVDYYDLWNKFLRERASKQIGDVRAKITQSLVIPVESLPHKLFLHVLDDYEGAVRYIREIVSKEMLCEPSFIRFSNFPYKISMRELRADKIGKFLTVQGLARSISSITPLVTVAMFECTNCGNRLKVSQSSLSVEYPDPCPCKRGKWVLDPSLSRMVDYQALKIQERPDDLRGGETPTDIMAYVVGDLCGVVNAGNRITVSGLLRPLINKRDSLIVKTVFETNNLVIDEQDFDDIKITQEDEQEITAFSKRDDLVSQLVSSIAPSIYGYENIKMAALLQLFGGIRHKNKDGTYKRGDTHILIVGDPGVAKSQLLEGIFQLCPRGVKASGKGSSKAGLTAAAVQDSTGSWTIEAGAIVLSDKGHLIVDEIDKMREEDRSALHEGMEQQKISIAKAGINTTLMCRCSILAAANPTTGRFDAALDIAEQIDLPPTLLSRFDLIFLMKDQPDQDIDGHIADFILSGNDTDASLSPEFMRKYISYSRKYITPVLTPVATKMLKNYYLRIRELANKNKPIPITARQLDALRRLSESAAKMRLSDRVEERDAELVISIVDSCLKHVAYDAETGQMDIDKMFNKMSAGKKDLKRDIQAMIRELTETNGRCDVQVLFQCLQAQGYDDRHKIDRLIDEMMREGLLYAKDNKTLNLVNRDLPI